MHHEAITISFDLVDGSRVAAAITPKMREHGVVSPDALRELSLTSAHLMVACLTEPLVFPRVTHAEALALLHEIYGTRLDSLLAFGQYDVVDALQDPTPEFLASLAPRDFDRIYSLAHDAPTKATVLMIDYAAAYARAMTGTMRTAKEATVALVNLSHNQPLVLDVLFDWCRKHPDDDIAASGLIDEAEACLHGVPLTRLPMIEYLVRDPGDCRELKDHVLALVRDAELQEGLRPVQSESGTLKKAKLRDVPGAVCTLDHTWHSALSELRAAVMHQGQPCCVSRSAPSVEPCACARGLFATELVRGKVVCVTCAEYGYRTDLPPALVLVSRIAAL
jgi:hypothetical protein